MKTLKQGLDRFLATVCIIDFIGMVLLTVYQVIMRYVFKSPSSVSEVLARYCFVWLILLSALVRSRGLGDVYKRQYLHHLFKR